MSFGIWELLIVLIIVALLFGTKKLRSMGTDLGGAVKGFRAALQEPEEGDASKGTSTDGSKIIDGEVESKEDAPHKV